MQMHKESKCWIQLDSWKQAIQLMLFRNTAEYTNASYTYVERSATVLRMQIGPLCIYRELPWVGDAENYDAP